MGHSASVFAGIFIYLLTANMFCLNGCSGGRGTARSSSPPAGFERKTLSEEPATPLPRSVGWTEAAKFVSSPDEIMVSSSALSPSIVEGEFQVGFSTRPPSEHDPFGLMPSAWPPDIPLHPQAWVAESGIYALTGLYIIALVPSDLATVGGVQNFYVTSLSTWESLQVKVYPDSEGLPTLTIIATKPDITAEISTQEGTLEFMKTLQHKDYWLDKMGPTPIVVYLFSRPTP